MSDQDLVTLAKFADLTGKTVKAMQRKIEDGRIVEGIHYHRDPDGGIWVSRKGMERWVTSVASRSGQPASGFTSAQAA